MRHLTKEQRKEVANDYAGFLLEINHRMDVLEMLFRTKCEGSAVNIYQQVDIELCYLQIRKIFELMMFGSLVAQSASQVTFEKRVHKVYKADQVLAFVKRKNPHFFPKAIRYVQKPDGTHALEARAQSVEKPHLTEPEFRNFYTRSIGGKMHANKTTGMSEEEQEMAYSELMAIYSKLVALLMHHALQLPTGDLMVATVHDKETKMPKVDIWLLADGQSVSGALFGG